jgi:hypothetical protein
LAIAKKKARLVGGPFSQPAWCGGPLHTFLQCLREVLDPLDDILGVRAQAIGLALDVSAYAADVVLNLAATAAERLLAAPNRALTAPLEPVQLADHAVKVRVGLGDLRERITERDRDTELDHHGALSLATDCIEPGRRGLQPTPCGAGGLARGALT